ncbi:MAG: hypothetical protein EBV32_04385 [Proteobacteria bacterium]|uniref:Uncharacterized protein n=1 Tax=Candidatus Fonsibacter lacus TaxID=2576439 RepID=A0A964XQT1_9PROT|nr:hypothetical protein [Candidatus Fonsibacter lacus]
MALEAPFRRLSIQTAGCAVVLVVLEELSQHVHVAHVTEGLTTGAQFDVIIRSRRSSSKQPVGHLAHKDRDLLPAGAVKALKNA